MVAGDWAVGGDWFVRVGSVVAGSVVGGSVVVGGGSVVVGGGRVVVGGWVVPAVGDDVVLGG